jgi:NAD(P)-dependent dehydrogenase (short-subunit alcohol dehydrogenase family)
MSAIKRKTTIRVRIEANMDKLYRKNICIALAKANYTVVFCDNNIDVGTQLAEAAQKQGLSIYFHHTNLNNLNEVKTIVGSVIKAFGSIDLLVNNVRAGKALDLFEENEQNWDESMNVMLKAAFFLSQNFILELRNQKKGGSIINIASVAAAYVGKESPSYHIAKAGIVQMTRYLATHSAKWGVRVNAIAPGFIVQDQHLEKYHSENNTTYRNVVEKTHPSSSIGHANDVAKAVKWLSSEEANFINGITLYLDGGLTIQDPYYVAYKLSKSV